MHNSYTPPIVTVDSVIFQLVNNELCVLLIKRANEPFKNSRALPGGYMPAGETTYETMERILSHKAGIDAKNLRHIEQLYTFDSVARDPRGHAIDTVYMALGTQILPQEISASQSPEFYPLQNLPDLAFDHADIITYAHDRLKSKIGYTNAIFALLAELFTLTELQRAYEAVLCRPLDKRNFRKKFLSLELIEPTSEKRSDGPHRPARLYKFKQQKLTFLERSFD